MLNSYILLLRLCAAGQKLKCTSLTKHSFTPEKKSVEIDQGSNLVPSIYLYFSLSVAEIIFCCTACSSHAMYFLAP